jgi:LPPG:FO 2-phospho-L-lactate transferase
MKVTVLAGGFGGARFARAIAESGVELTVVGNVGDDAEILGLHVSPDLDAILYALAGIGDEERGWGRADETWNALDTVGMLGGETWFQLGDRDLGVHVLRTQALRAGEQLSSVTARFVQALAIEATVLPATDDELRTRVETPVGELAFQEWYVGRRHEDEVTGVRYKGEARPAPGVLEALADADLIAIAPSNPFLSIGPILAVAGIRAALEARRVPAVAVSPLIGGRTVKGPADRMLERFTGGTSPRHVAGVYEGLIDSLVVDEADAGDGNLIVTRTLMSDLADAIGETPLLCVASDLRFTKKGVEPGREHRSLAEDVAEILRGPVASGYQSLGAASLDGPGPLDEDVFVSGEESAAKELALDLGARLVAGHAIDAGPLANSRGLEAMTAVLLNVNRRYRTHAGLRVTGLP